MFFMKRMMACDANLWAKKTKLYEDVLKNFPDAKLKDVITNEEEEDR